jgi:hypothetical protein
VTVGCRCHPLLATDVGPTRIIVVEAVGYSVEQHVDDLQAWPFRSDSRSLFRRGFQGRGRHNRQVGTIGALRGYRIAGGLDELPIRVPDLAPPLTRGRKSAQSDGIRWTVDGGVMTHPTNNTAQALRQSIGGQVIAP